MDLETLNKLGLPGWFIIGAATLFILKQLGLLDNIVEFFRKKETAKTLKSLQEDYKDNWLQEQLAVAHQETLVQLGNTNDFIRDEVNTKLDIVIELNSKVGDLVANLVEIRTRLGELFSLMNDLNQRTSNMQNSENDLKEKFEDFYSELDIVNRQLSEIVRLLNVR